MWTPKGLGSVNVQTPALQLRPMPTQRWSRQLKPESRGQATGASGAVSNSFFCVQTSGGVKIGLSLSLGLNLVEAHLWVRKTAHLSGSRKGH